MEKELFQSTLLDKAKAANNNAPIDNLSERTISEVVSMFLPQFADDTKITDESWTLPVQMVKTLSGQLRHDTSLGINDFKTKFETEQKAAMEKAKQDAIDAFKAEWEKTHPKQEPPKDAGDVDQKVADAVAKAMAGITGDEGAIGKLSKQFSEFLAAQAEKEKAITVANAREQVRDYLISRGVDEDDFALEYTLERLEIGEKPDIAALNAKAEKDYEANYKKIYKKDGAHPFAGGGGGEDETAGAKGWLASREKRTQSEAEAAEARRKLLK